MAVKKTGKSDCDTILGPHPDKNSIFAECLSATDGSTDGGSAHRNLEEVAGKRKALVSEAREMLKRHHVSSEAIVRDKKRMEAMKKLGFETEARKLKRFPASDTTRKGNFAEVILAEYVLAATDTSLPVYRLRYNPNIDQSMKGDDVLAFGLDDNPVRLFVGEAKFRKQSSKQVVSEIAESLRKSNVNGLPTSLTFVLDRLYEAGNNALAEKVQDCVVLSAKGKLQLSYVGFLMSDGNCAQRVQEMDGKLVDRFVIISFGLDAPDKLVEQCFKELEEALT